MSAAESASHLHVDVCSVVAEHGVWGLLEVRPQGNLVGHCARREEYNGLLSGYLGHMGLERGGCGFMVDIISKGSEGCIEVHLLRRNCIDTMLPLALRWGATREDACL